MFELLLHTVIVLLVRKDCTNTAHTHKKQTKLLCVGIWRKKNRRQKNVTCVCAQVKTIAESVWIFGWLFFFSLSRLDGKFVYSFTFIWWIVSEEKKIQNHTLISKQKPNSFVCKWLLKSMIFFFMKIESKKERNGINNKSSAVAIPSATSVEK